MLSDLTVQFARVMIELPDSVLDRILNKEIVLRSTVTEPVPFGERGRECEEMGIRGYADKGEELKLLTKAMEMITVKKDIVVKVEHITNLRERGIAGV